VDGEVIRAGDIPKYCTDEFYQFLMYYQLTKLLGCPNGRGWANEPVEFIEAFLALEGEENKIQKEEMEKHKNVKPTGHKPPSRRKPTVQRGKRK